MNYYTTEKPYHLNTQSIASKPVGNMFGRRKKSSSGAQNTCPYCNTPNEIDAKQCKLCYYELTVSAREQPMATPSTAASEIMTTLLDSDLTDEIEEDYAVEAVLSLDEVTVEIDQFDPSSATEDTKFDFISSTGPTLSDVQDYSAPVEVELSPEDAPQRDVEFQVPSANPLDEVAEPVHTGQGSLFIDSGETDDDYTGSVGPAESGIMEPELISDAPEPNQVPISAAISQPILNETPDLPDIFDNVKSPSAAPDETPAVPEIPNDVTSSVTHDTPEVPDIPSSNTNSAPKHKPAPSPAPTPQFNGRVWPWPAKQAWDERRVYREVVAILELVKTGKLAQTAQQLDNLGPHLDGNLDMLAHIGTIMRYLGREEHLQWMLAMAKTTYPNDPNVAKALTHLT
tara:strand:- start:1925 stop:3121 length:1197 start_codon:yes stop_codon:yes gene_type:complete